MGGAGDVASEANSRGYKRCERAIRGGVNDPRNELRWLVDHNERHSDRKNWTGWV
jgi:hypothetical protein